MKITGYQEIRANGGGAENAIFPVFIDENERWRMRADGRMVPLAGIEPALLAELDFESSASTNSATGAPHDARQKKPASQSRRNIAVGDCRSTRQPPV
jgi:hypothetical protein